MADNAIKKIQAILEANKDKDFVQRILKPAESPWIDKGGGIRATHLMAWGEMTDDEGKPTYYVFPTILRDGDGLKEYGDKAFDEALRRKEYITFDSPEEADWFSRSYKQVWPASAR